MDPGTTAQDVQFGQLAVRKGFLTAERLKSLLTDLAAERAQGRRVSLGDLFLRCGILRAGDIRDLLREQKKAILYCPVCILRYNILDYDPARPYYCKHCRGKIEETAPQDPSEYDWTSGDSSSRLPALTDAERLARQNRAFGEIAVAKKYLTRDQLDLALAMSQKSNQQLGFYCVSKGLLHPGHVEEILAEQNKTALVCRSCETVYTVRDYSPYKMYHCRRCQERLETGVLGAKIDQCEEYPDDGGAVT